MFSGNLQAKNKFLRKCPYVQNGFSGFCMVEGSRRREFLQKLKAERNEWISDSKMKRIYLAAIAFSIVVLVGGVFLFWSWYSEQVLENLKGYSARLEDDGFIVEEKPLTEVHVDAKQEWYWFSDFRSYAKTENITVIYFDQGIKGLYYLTPVSPTNSSIVAIIFYYNKIF
jgi:hypothetical protein